LLLIGECVVVVERGCVLWAFVCAFALVIGITMECLSVVMFGVWDVYVSMVICGAVLIAIPKLFTYE